MTLLAATSFDFAWYYFVRPMKFFISGWWKTNNPYLPLSTDDNNNDDNDDDSDDDNNDNNNANNDTNNT